MNQAAEQPATVPARPAATVLLVRDAEPTGVEVFVLRRTANAVFAADMYVFPGGRVDDVDHTAELEPYCDGLDDATASARLGIDKGGLAFWVAAVRECFEEAGLLEMTYDEGIVTQPLSFERISDGLRRTAEFGERVKEMVGRLKAMHIKLHARAGQVIEQMLQPLDVRSLLDWMNEALVPDSSGGSGTSGGCHHASLSMHCRVRLLAA